MIHLRLGESEMKRSLTFIQWAMPRAAKKWLWTHIHSYKATQCMCSADLSKETRLHSLNLAVLTHPELSREVFLAFAGTCFCHTCFDLGELLRAMP